MGEPGEPYRPSSGTESDSFMSRHCYQCRHERWLHRQKEDRDEDKCPIISLSMGYDVDDPLYPKEWTYNKDSKPTCTKFSFWDWSKGEEPPEKPDEPDPNQLDLFP